VQLNKTEAAQRLGISRSTSTRKIKKYQRQSADSALTPQGYSVQSSRSRSKKHEPFCFHPIGRFYHPV